MEKAPVLYRPRSGAVVAGVCAGLGRRWQVDPVLLRIAAVVLSFAGGLGLIAYAAAVLLIPREGSTVMPIRNLLPFTRTWSTSALIAAVGFGSALLIALLGGWSGIGMGPLLIVGAVWYVSTRRARTERHGLRSPVPTDFERAAQAWRQRLLEQRGFTSTDPAAEPVGPPVWPASPVAPLAVTRALVPGVSTAPVRRLRGREWRWWLLAVVLAVIGTGLVGLWPPGSDTAVTAAYWAAGLVALGFTLVASAGHGRAPLMLAATVVAGVVAVVTMLPAGPDIGEVRRAFASATDLPAEVTLGLGEVDLDLSALDLDADASTTVRIGAGTARLTLPDDVNTDITWRVKAGEFLSGGDQRSGLDLVGREVATPNPGGPTLRVDITVQAGSLEVIR